MTTTPSSPQRIAVLSESASARLSVSNKFLGAVIFLYWLTYENVIFFYPRRFAGTGFVVLTYGLKLLLPFVILYVIGLPSRVISRGPTRYYLVFFSAFLLWSLVPTVVSGDVVTWAKLLPRYVFFLSALGLCARRPAVFALFAKCVVIYVLSALLQYILLTTTGPYQTRETVALLAGPFGLLGNVGSRMTLPGAPILIVRLCGFWNEPSNASASAFVAFFLARYLVSTGARPFWRKASYGCLAAGLLTLSNAGYFALGCALSVGLLATVRRFTVRRVLLAALLLPIAVGLLGGALFGRRYVAEYFPDNAWARAITGARDTDEAARNPFAGRIAIAQQTLQTTGETLIGVGIQVVGSEGIEGSATAPLYWLLLTGIPGIVLLLGRETVLLAAGRSLMRRQPAMLPLVQALVVVMAQHLSYGTWMNPNYLILAAMVLVQFQKSTQRVHPASATVHAQMSVG